MVAAIIIISFVLDSIISNVISMQSFLMPLCTLMALIVIYPYFNHNIKNYLITCFITGLFYDLIYTDTIIVHAILFLTIGFIITKINYILSYNYINVIIMAIICIIFYRFVSYGLLLITANVSFNTLSFIKSITHSLLLNIIYIVVIYLITDKISYKLRIRKIN